MRIRAAAGVLVILSLGCSGSGSGGHGGAGSTSATSSTSTTSGAGGTGAGPGESCLDGLDNDGNGKVDCADPACQSGNSCVDGPVSGWEGALLVQRVPYPAATPPDPCPDGKAPSVYYAGPSDATCDPCDCSLMGATCLPPEMSCSVMSGSCMGMYTPQVYKTTDTACHDAMAPFPNHSCRLSKGSQVGSTGTCEATGGTLSLPQPWAEEVRVCAAAGGGCGPGQVCAPRIPAGFEDAICMGQQGNTTCPAGWTDVDLPVFEGGTDQRACSACGCDTSQVTCTGGQYTLHAGNGCSSSNTIVINGACQSIQPILNMQDAPFSYTAKPGDISGLACTGGTPSGSVETSGPRRICCKKAAP